MNDKNKKLNIILTTKDLQKIPLIKLKNCYLIEFDKLKEKVKRNKN